MKNESISIAPLPAPAAAEFRQLRLDSVEESRTNPRTDFPPGPLAELQESIKARGIEEPLIVRPIPLSVEEVTAHIGSKEKPATKPMWHVFDPRGRAASQFPKEGGMAVGYFSERFDTEKEARGVQRYELIAGARRSRCANALKLATVPCYVKQASDAEVQESQFLSFLREPLSDLEEARALKRLLDLQPGANLDERIKALEPKTGKKRSTILSAVSVLKCVPKVQEAIGGDITASHAQVIAGVPTHLQEKLLHEIRNGNYAAATMSVRDLTEHVKEHYRVNLKDAPFKLDDAALDPKAGPCLKCPKRQDPNICTDVACYQGKRELTFKAQEAAARRNGQTVLGPKEWEKVRYTSQYVELSESCWQDSKQRKWKDLVGKDAKPMLARDREGDLIEVLPKDTALKLAKANGAKISSGAGDDYDKKRRKEQAENRTKREIFKDALAQALPLISMAGLLDPANTVAFWKLMAAIALRRIGNGQSNEESIFINYRKLIVTGKGYDAGEKALQQCLDGLKSVPDLRQFTMEALAIDGWLHFYNVEWGENFTDICAHFGVDLKKLEKAATEARTAKKNGKTAPAPAKAPASIAVGKLAPGTLPKTKPAKSPAKKAAKGKAKK